MGKNYPIQNKVALVTGANRGIGKAILESFIANGAAKVYAAVRNTASVEALVEKYGEKVVPLTLDLSKPETIAAAARLAGDVEVVVNNAGVYKPGGVLDEEVFEAWNYHTQVNVFGLIHIARAFAPVLKANGGGAFVQLNSVVSFKSFAGADLYAASKAAAYSVTQSLREHLADQDTLVLSVHPGPIATDMGSEAGLDDIAEPPAQVGDAIVEALASGEFHVYTDTLSRQLGGAYHSFAKGVVEAKLLEG
jgi:NAD(P)-dependent dehydrogenase (short-subunit alcohol dehydrogenase family)